MARIAIALGAHDNPILHFSDARRSPGGSLGLFAFDPRPNRPLEDDLAAARFDGDAVGIDLGIAPECLLYLPLDFCGLGVRLELDQIADAFDAFDSTYRILGRAALILPLGLAFERTPMSPTSRLAPTNQSVFSGGIYWGGI